MIQLFVILVVLGASLPSIHGNDQPIEPDNYAKMIKQGFATNYFKVLPPARRYNPQNIEDVYNMGFRNLRLRSRADLYTAPYNTDPTFKTFLQKLEDVVDKCLATKVIPIISWIHHKAEAKATDTDKQNYVSWWTLVADRLKNKDYRLSFNLFTELGIDECKNTGDCSQSLRENTAKYTEWTKAAVAAIRGTEGNNLKRILILTSPEKTAKGLSKIDSSIYKNDKYLMAEFHLYASGPNQIEGSAKYWKGDGTGVGKENVRESLRPALEWTAETNIPTYFGAWMAEDNKNKNSLSEKEIKKFARYFVLYLKEKGIPWSMNTLDRYYDTDNSAWIKTPQEVQKTEINFKAVLNVIKKNM